MATNTGDDHRNGAVKGRTQVKGPDDKYNKRDRADGRFMDHKSDDKPFKGIAKEPDGRQDK